MKDSMAAGILCLAGIGCAWSFNAPDGVRGHVWRSAPSDLGPNTLAEDDGSTKCYTKNGDDLSVGDAQLEKIAYCYYKDQLYFVTMNFSGTTNFSGLKSAMFQKFGAGSKPNQFMEDYTWMSAEVYIDLKYSEIGHKGGITYMYRPLSAESQKESDEKAKKAADKL